MTLTDVDFVDEKKMPKGPYHIDLTGRLIYDEEENVTSDGLTE